MPTGTGSGTGSGIPNAPILSITNDGDGDAVTATVAGDAAATTYLLYRKPGDAAWTQGESVVGSGAIPQAGLDAETEYSFIAVSQEAGAWGLPSFQVSLFVTAGTTKVLNIVAIRNIGEGDRQMELLCVEAVS